MLEEGSADNTDNGVAALLTRPSSDPKTAMEDIAVEETVFRDQAVLRGTFLPLVEYGAAARCASPIARRILKPSIHSSRSPTALGFGISAMISSVEKKRNCLSPTTSDEPGGFHSARRIAEDHGRDLRVHGGPCSLQYCAVTDRPTVHSMHSTILHLGRPLSTGTVFPPRI